MKVAILGSGPVGGKLGFLLSGLGYDIAVGVSDSVLVPAWPDAANDWSIEQSPADVVATSDVVIVACDIDDLEDIVRASGPIAGKTVIACVSGRAISLFKGNYLDGSGAISLARLLPEAQIVCAFGSVDISAFDGVYEWRHQRRRPNLMISGDWPEAKARVSAIARDLGFEPIDCGRLEQAHLIEQLGALMKEINRLDAGGRTYLIESFR